MSTPLFTEVGKGGGGRCFLLLTTAISEVSDTHTVMSQLLTKQCRRNDSITHETMRTRSIIPVKEMPKQNDISTLPPIGSRHIEIE